jgi:tripartite-type tricarboxylate transporter receptor subunit TctC
MQVRAGGTHDRAWHIRRRRGRARGPGRPRGCTERPRRGLSGARGRDHRPLDARRHCRPVRPRAGQRFTHQLGQRFIIVNKAGASGVIGTAAVAQAKPDGYTLLHGAAFSITVQPLTDSQAHYDYRSFDPICQTFKNDQVIVARRGGRFKTAQDLVDAARARPGALNYGHPGIATIPHLAMIEFARLAKVEFNQVPFKGPADAIQMTLAGQIDFAAVPLSTAAASGLAMPGLFAPARNPAIPNVATMREQGFDVAPLSFGALVGPAGLPAGVKHKLADACRVSAHSDAYIRAARSAFQPSDYYGDSATLAGNLAQDVAEKKRLLGELGLLK